MLHLHPSVYVCIRTFTGPHSNNSFTFPIIIKGHQLCLILALVISKISVDFADSFSESNEGAVELPRETESVAAF
jgi:hypothetical protein